MAASTSLAARGYLPTDLPSNPTYRKVNPADAPILIMALSSDVYDPGRLYDLASTILQQKLSQVQGVSQVIVGGLLVSQFLTLYTTPVIYLFFDRLAVKLAKFRAREKSAARVPMEPA